jgi:hypothetical protein
MHACRPADSFFVGVAFKRGDPRSIQDELIMQTTGGEMIHSEFMLGRPRDIRCYTACCMLQQGSVQIKHESGFTPSRRFTSLPSRDEGWECVCFPLLGHARDYKSVYSVLLQLMALQLPYNYQDLWQCCSKAVLPFERDLDYTNFSEWKARGVFCSQVCLLLLRRFDSQGLIRLPTASRYRVYASNSRGCSPNSLFYTLGAPEPATPTPQR